MPVLSGDNPETLVKIVGRAMSSCEACGKFESVDVWRFESGLQLRICDACIAGVKTKLCVGMVIPAAHARRTDPDTSKIAARSVNVTRGQENVRRIIERAFGPGKDFTLDDLVDACAEWWPRMIAGKWTPSGVRSRCRELVDRGTVARVGKRRLKTGRAGHIHRLVA